jgi:2-oxoglutarate ferredoxin oxidoreductase subunit beta
MHDGSIVAFKGVPPDYDPTDRERVFAYLQERQGKGEIVTGLLYIDEDAPEMHELNQTPEESLTKIPFEKLCPGSAALSELQDEYR